jgi:hypothetical protein
VSVLVGNDHGGAHHEQQRQPDDLTSAQHARSATRASDSGPSTALQDAGVATSTHAPNRSIDLRL